MAPCRSAAARRDRRLATRSLGISTHLPATDRRRRHRAADRGHPELFDFARAHELRVVAYSVLLNGAYTRPDRPIPWGYRGPDTEARLTCAREIAAELGAPTNQVVLAWLQSTPDCPVIPIIGGSRLEQLQENLRASAMRLSLDQRTGSTPPALRTATTKENLHDRVRRAGTARRPGHVLRSDALAREVALTVWLPPSYESSDASTPSSTCSTPR